MHCTTLIPCFEATFKASETNAVPIPRLATVPLKLNLLIISIVKIITLSSYDTDILFSCIEIIMLIPCSQHKYIKNTFGINHIKHISSTMFCTEVIKKLVQFDEFVWVALGFEICCCSSFVRFFSLDKKYTLIFSILNFQQRYMRCIHVLQQSKYKIPFHLRLLAQ